MWDVTAGGHVLSGEMGFQALIREAKEELGIDLQKQDLTFIGSSISSNVKGDIVNNHFNEYYIANADIDETTLTLQAEEVADVKWMDKEEIIKTKNEILIQKRSPQKRKEPNVWLDTYIVRQEINLEDIIMQKEEVCDVKWATFDEIEELYHSQQFMKNRWEYIRDFIQDML